MACRRTSVFKEDLAKFINICNSCLYTELQEHSDECIGVILKHPSQEAGRQKYTFIIGADYPEGTVVCSEGGNLEAISGRVNDILKMLVTDWCTSHQWDVPDIVKTSLEPPCSSLTASTNYYRTQVSAASSEYTDASEPADDEDDIDDYNDYDYDMVHPLIEAEIGKVKQMYGENSVEFRSHAGIDEMDIFFNIDLNNFLDEYTSSAWGVKLTEPLVVLLHVRSVSNYLDGLEAVVDVFQAPAHNKTEKRKVALGSQMRKIIQTFVSEQWKRLSNSDIENISPVDETAIKKPSTSNDLSSTIFCRQESLGAQMDAPEEDESSDPMVVKQTPSLQSGFLVQCLNYALNRIRTLNEFCVICDERHVIETGLIKPCVCTRELCVFAFQTLGVMADAAETIATDGNVVDLLIAMANAAANSPRAEVIFDPFPSIVHPNNLNELALDPKSKDFALVRTVLKRIVESRKDLLAGKSQNLKVDLDSHHKLAFPLMQWIIATCRAHIVLLPEDRCLSSMHTKYQFLLISSPPGKEAAFQSAKAKNGSTFAFHGSNIENWHSIMRAGLINASGTKLQIHGAAYGKGIYLSPLSSVSFGYTGYTEPASKPKPPGTIESLSGKCDIKCLALCEVVQSQQLKKTGNIWVCPNSDDVCTRFFFVFDNVRGCQSEVVDTRLPKYKKQIDHAVAHLKQFKRKVN